MKSHKHEWSSPAKRLMDVVAFWNTRTSGHTAQLRGKKKKGPNSWTHFCQRHPANRWHGFQIKSHRCAERVLKTRVFINAFFLPLHFQLSNLSSVLSALTRHPQGNDVSQGRDPKRPARSSPPSLAWCDIEEHPPQCAVSVWATKGSQESQCAPLRH